MFEIIKLLLGGQTGLIKSMDKLEKPFADLIRKGQSRAGGISPDEFAKELVDEMQKKLCEWRKIDPKEIDPTF